MGRSRRNQLAVALAAALVAILVLLVVAARLRSGAVHRLDVRIDDQVNRWVYCRPWLVDSWKVITDAGGPTTWRVLAGVAAVLLFLRGLRREFALVVGAMVAAAVLSGVFKSRVGRPRPVVPHPIEHVGGGSFPSGHALTSATALGLLVLMATPRLSRVARRWLIGVAAVIVLLVGASRVMLGVHYVSDVLGGWAMAALLLLVAIRLSTHSPVVAQRETG